MAVKNDGGGYAFPQPLIETRDGAFEQPEDDKAGMTLRDYFAAHAPVERWRYYQPTMATPRPDADWNGVSDSARALSLSSANNWKELATWDSEWNRQHEIQWPYFYADAMIAERAK